MTLLALSSTLERSVDTNGAMIPDSIPISAVADRVFEVMWQQVAPFVPLHGSAAVRLRQMRPNGRGAHLFFEATLQAHQAAESLERPTWQQLCQYDPAPADELRTNVVKTLVKNPCRASRCSGRQRFRSSTTGPGVQTAVQHPSLGNRAGRTRRSSSRA